MQLRLAEHPQLLSLHAARVEELYRAGITPRLLALQAPLPHPQPDRGWGMVPPIDSSPLVDLSGMAANLITTLLVDLLALQRQRALAPFLLVPPDSLQAQRLIAGSPLACIVAPADAPIAIAYWAGVSASFHPDQQHAHQLWIELPAPPPPYLDARLLPLLAALDQTVHFNEAAAWCRIEPSDAYALLRESCRALDVPTDWGDAHVWAALLYDALAR